MLGSSEPVSEVQRRSAHCGTALIVKARQEPTGLTIETWRKGKKRNYNIQVKPRGYRTGTAYRPDKGRVWDDEEEKRRKKEEGRGESPNVRVNGWRGWSDDRWGRAGGGCFKREVIWTD